MWISKKKWEELHEEVWSQKGFLMQIAKILGIKMYIDTEKITESEIVIGLLQRAIELLEKSNSREKNS